MQKTVVVVPCYNEASRLSAEPFLEACAASPELSFIFVDDGSSDETFPMLRALAQRRPAQLSVLRLEHNSGKAEAVRRGVLQAFDTAADLIGFWDADLATPLYNIERFAQALVATGVQMVVGSRVRLLGHDIRRTALRHYTGRGFATLAALALRLPVYDTQCGAKIFHANAIFREIFAEPFQLGWSFDVELFARLLRVARRAQLDPKKVVVEVPLQEWIDAPGSKLRPHHFPRIAWELCKLFVIVRRT